jgi:hypothetical protein
VAVAVVEDFGAEGIIENARLTIICLKNFIKHSDKTYG